MNYYYFAQAYGENNYGACNYQQNATGCTTTGGGAGAGAGAGGTLTNTGLMLAVIVTAACLLAVTAIIVRVWRRQKAVPQEVDERDEPDESQDYIRHD